MADRTEEFEKVKHEVHGIINNLDSNAPPKARAMIEEAIAQMLTENKLPKDVLGFTPDMLELIYKHGYSLFQTGKYKEALIVFNMLRQLDISDPRYTFAIAAGHHYLHEYLDAAANYSIYKFMNPLDPIPCFHLYDCYLKAGYPLSALAAIQEALVLADYNPHQYAGLREKIQLELNHLQENLKEKLEKQVLLKKDGSA